MQINPRAALGMTPLPQRVNRTPSFPLAGVMKPYGLYPIWAHPVLPGETVQSVSVKSRVIGMPVNHPLSGAWLEQWLVYVKFTDIDPDLGQMFISDSVSTSGFTAGADRPRYFTKSGQIDWIKLATDRFHSAYFKDDDETAAVIDAVPKVRLNNASWYQNMIFAPADAAVPVTDASDTYQHLSGWMMLQQMNMTELTYEKYLETFGVRPRKEELGDPEVLRFARQWVTPVNTVNPETGAPSSAWVFSGDFALEKPKRFDEPGFLVAFATVRPKMFNGQVGASLIGELWGFSDWFPSYTLDDPTAGVRDMLNSSSVFTTPAAGGDIATLRYDHRDLLSHGEQFVNLPAVGTGAPYRIPVSQGMDITASTVWNLRGLYPTDADIDALFVESLSYKGCYYEGIAMATISGHVRDTTK